jgi:hypothetical protein
MLAPALEAEHSHHSMAERPTAAGLRTVTVFNHMHCAATPEWSFLLDGLPTRTLQSELASALERATDSFLAEAETDDLRESSQLQGFSRHKLIDELMSRYNTVVFEGASHMIGT